MKHQQLKNESDADGIAPIEVESRPASGGALGTKSGTVAEQRDADALQKKDRRIAESV
jgi:hypothetical protein